MDRACIGDLLQDPDDAAVFYAVVLTDKAEFITVNFTSAGHSPVHVETCTELPPRLLTGPERELHEATVSALRADAVLAAMMHTSRTKAAEEKELRKAADFHGIMVQRISFKGR